MTRSKNTNKQIDNPEFLKIFMQESFQEFLEQEIAIHLGALPYERTEGRRGHRNGTQVGLHPEVPDLSRRRDADQSTSSTMTTPDMEGGHNYVPSGLRCIKFEPRGLACHPKSMIYRDVGMRISLRHQQ